jgi:hypothetical protein
MTSLGIFKNYLYIYMKRLRLNSFKIKSTGKLSKLNESAEMEYFLCYLQCGNYEFSYRWLFMRKEQKYLPKPPSENLKSLKFHNRIHSMEYFSIYIDVWYTFLNKKSLQSLWFYRYCLRNEGFQIFGCEFGEWFLFLSQKSHFYENSCFKMGFDFKNCFVEILLNCPEFLKKY